MANTPLNLITLDKCLRSHAAYVYQHYHFNIKKQYWLSPHSCSIRHIYIYIYIYIYEYIKRPLFMTMCIMNLTHHFDIKLDFTRLHGDLSGSYRTNNGWRTDGRRDARTNERTDERTDRRTDGWTDGRTDVRTDARTEERTDGRTDARTDGQTDGWTDG